MAIDDLTPTYSNPLCGIYTITHIRSGRVYVGSSAKIYARWNHHRNSLNKNKHHTKFLQRAWNKYGESAFTFAVIELCSVPELVDRENAHMTRLNVRDPKCGFNHAPAAGSNLGIKYGPMSAAQRAAIGAAHKGKIASPETRARLSASLKGRVMSKEWCLKIAVANTGRKMAPLTAEHKAIVSRVHKGKSIPDWHRQRVSETHKGKKQSPELVEKRRKALKAYWDRRKNGPWEQLTLTFQE